MKIAVFSTKRSTHHAFLESFLSGKSYFYENNLITKSLGKHEKVLKPVVTLGDASSSDFLYVASFEMGYKLPDIIKSSAFEDKFKDFGSYKKVIFLRDPLNTLASTLSVYYRRLEKNNNFPVSWVYKNIATWVNAFMYSKYSEDFTLIYANKFWRCRDYQESVSSFLESDLTQVGHVSRFANGGNSFFEGGDVSSEALENRYKKFIEDEIFLSIVKENINLFYEFLDFHEEYDKLKFLDEVVK